MSPRLLAAVLAALSLAACAGDDTRELVGASWDANPEAIGVVENEFNAVADYKCRGGWDTVSQSQSQEDGRYITKRLIRCRDPRP
ncbi:MAG: hypothetical protein H7Z12_15330 [Rhodospirillaceae bacterium]|nr:hypothetical protein [Rhodospirillales bacterium]